MSEAYQHTEYELRNDIDNINCISYTFERYVEEVNHFIDRLLEDTKEINVLRSDIKEKDKEIERLNNIIKEVREYITSYDSISTIQGFENIEANKGLDEKTLNEMVRRYMILHDKLLEILDKGSDKK